MCRASGSLKLSSLSPLLAETLPHLTVTNGRCFDSDVDDDDGDGDHHHHFSNSETHPFFFFIIFSPRLIIIIIIIITAEGAVFNVAGNVK